jgi:hypothetical protein
MIKVVSCILIGAIVLSGGGTAVTALNLKNDETNRKCTCESPYVDELDQYMTAFDGTVPVGNAYLGSSVNLSVAQSFIPQLEVLTRVQFLMACNTSTSQPCVLAVRDNLTGSNLAVTQLAPSEFPVVNDTPTQDQLAWVTFNIDDIWVNSGQTYYLVLYTTNLTGNYYWVAVNETNIYPNGTGFLSIDQGVTWTEIADADGCFQTYGLHETFLQITPSSGLGLSFIIKNVGNYTAWDVTVSLTIDGGLVVFGKSFSTVKSEIPPGGQIIFQPGFILGFGKVIISLRVSAANVKEISSQTNAIVLLFFIIAVH